MLLGYSIAVDNFSIKDCSYSYTMVITDITHNLDCTIISMALVIIQVVDKVQ